MEGRKALPVCLERRKPRLLLLVEIRSAVDGRPEELDDPSRRLRIERTERRSALQRRRAVRVGRRLQGRQILPLLQYARCDRRGRGRGRTLRPVRSATAGPSRESRRSIRPFSSTTTAGLSLLGTVLGQGRQAEGQYARGRHDDDRRRARDRTGALLPRGQQHAQAQRNLLHGLFPSAQRASDLHRIRDVALAPRSVRVRRGDRRQCGLRSRVVEQSRLDLRVRRPVVRAVSPDDEPEPARCGKFASSRSSSTRTGVSTRWR